MSDEARAELASRISQAKAALDGARAACWHCPSGDNVQVMEMCEHTVNDLLDCWLALDRETVEVGPS